jgi:nitrate/TMAO reductase-like tetraheme cytochrome c subunit
VTAAPLALLVSGFVVFAATGRLPRPEGWIGTTEQWTRGLGLALCVLALVVLVLAWRHLARGGSVRTILGMLFFGLLVLPIIIIFFGYAKGLEGMETERACGGCHVMTGHVNDLRQPDSESLAAVHFKNRYIRETPCYTCHSDYGMFGALSAKTDGVRHVVHYVARTYTLPLKIREPYSNLRCLECHADSQKFLKSEGHPAEIRPDLASGKTSCLECHGPAHTPAEAGQ